MIPTPNKSALDEIMHEIPASSIPLEKPQPPAPKVIPNIDEVSSQTWAGKSNELAEDYKYGRALAQFGENELTAQRFFKRLSLAICGTITNEYQKRGESTETLKPYYNILESCMLLLANEMTKKGLKDFDVSSVIATMQGFITNYNTRKVK